MSSTAPASHRPGHCTSLVCRLPTASSVILAQLPTPADAAVEERRRQERQRLLREQFKRRADQRMQLPKLPATGHSAGQYIVKRAGGAPALAMTLASDLPGLIAGLLAAATAKRWEVETGDITLPGGVRVNTAKVDQDRVPSAVVNAVARHVPACFTAEPTHHEAIVALQPSEAGRPATWTPAGLRTARERSFNRFQRTFTGCSTHPGYPE